MKPVLTSAIVLLLLVMMSCKQETKTTTYQDEDLNVTTSVYPDDINAVFEAHGGMDPFSPPLSSDAHS